MIEAAARIVAAVARGEEVLREGYDIRDAEIDAEYWRLRALHPDPSACCRLEPGAGRCHERAAG